MTAATKKEVKAKSAAVEKVGVEKSKPQVSKSPPALPSRAEVEELMKRPSRELTTKQLVLVRRCQTGLQRIAVWEQKIQRLSEDIKQRERERAAAAEKKAALEKQYSKLFRSEEKTASE